MENYFLSLILTKNCKEMKRAKTAQQEGLLSPSAGFEKKRASKQKVKLTDEAGCVISSQASLDRKMEELRENMFIKKKLEEERKENTGELDKLDFEQKYDDLELKRCYTKTEEACSENPEKEKATGPTTEVEVVHWKDELIEPKKNRKGDKNKGNTVEERRPSDRTDTDHNMMDKTMERARLKNLGGLQGTLEYVSACPRYVQSLALRLSHCKFAAYRSHAYDVHPWPSVPMNC
ncbi:uncharacterized protein [Aegilops tauschii subsp. strangulata]|uniref:uncharacterized protein isoform X2 n=1 Tax=Aegilops tauschii subsp. strangulata TaxID=200361 RepID=UPI003CC8D194